ncbi:MAG: tRNA lysidine(34) synthetase TilS [Bacteroidota bacterium]
MTDLQKQFQEFLTDQKLLFEGEKVLLAVSGGLDSMVMLHLFAQTQFSIGVAHCNFGLRGAASDLDQKFVADHCQEKQIPFFSKSLTIKGSSVQVTARNLRYEWFHALAAQEEFDKIATAHHLNDSFETTLMNLTRGTGLEGLAGIPIKNNSVIRPMLFANREKILEYAVAQKITWREDATNSKKDYKRNKIRHDLIPELEALNPSLLHTFSNTNERIRLVNSIIQSMTDQILKEHWVDQENRLNLSWIKETSDLIFLARILSKYGFNYTASRQLFETRSSPGKVFLSGEFTATVDRNCLIITRPTPAKAIEAQLWKGEEIQVSDTLIKADPSGLLARDLIQMNKEDLSNPSREFVDTAKLKFPLTVRSWRRGDAFHPLGMTGIKKVSDLLVDLKVPLTEKSKVLVLTSDEKIVWVLGYRLSEEFKVRAESGEILLLSSTKVKP